MIPNYMGSMPGMSQFGNMANLPAPKGRAAARTAAIIATVLAVMYVLFNYWPLTEEMAKLLVKWTDTAKTRQIISGGIMILEYLLGLYLAKCVISMTANASGRWAGTLLSIPRSVGIIYYGTILSYVISGSRPSRSFFFNTEGFTIGFNVGSAVLVMVAGLFFINAVRGAARGLLSLGYFFFGLLQLAYFLIVEFGDLEYDALLTFSRIYSVLCIIALIVIVAGYYANLRQYGDEPPQAPYRQPYQQQPGQPYYNPQTPYQQPGQQAPYQQPAQQAPYQQPYGPQPQQPYGQPPQQPYGPQTQQQPPQQRPPQPPQSPYPPRQNPPRPTPPPPPAP